MRILSTRPTEAIHLEPLSLNRAIIVCEDVVNTATFYQLTYTATYSTTSANNVNYWKDSYRLLNRCNIIVDGVRDCRQEQSHYGCPGCHL